MASQSQNRFLNQTVASAQKTQTPSKTQLTQSTSTTSQFAKLQAQAQLQMQQQNQQQLSPQQDSDMGLTRMVSTKPSGSALEIHNNTSSQSLFPLPSQTSQLNASSTTMSPMKSGGALTQSQANLRTNMFTKTNQQAQPGYQPSYLREPTHKNSSYSSVSPMKHQARLQQSTSSVKKYGQHFSNSKRQGNKLASDSKSTLGQRTNITNALTDSKLRSGSQYVAAKKLYSGHQTSNSTTRGGYAAQVNARANQQKEEYQGDQTQTQRSSQQPVVENSFTRLHKGNSSVVRTFERKQLLQQSTSQVRKQQTPINESALSRFQQNKFRNSNATSSNTRASGQNPLFHTRDRPNTNSQLNMAQPYQSNNSAQGGTTRPAQPTSVNPMDSDRTADSSKNDTARNGNNRYKGQTKQPRQSKSTSNKQNNQAANPNQLRQQQIATEIERPNQLIPPPTCSSALAILTPQSQDATPVSGNANQRQLNASQSMTQVFLTSQPSSEQTHNRPNTSGLETSLSFTRRLIEETAARNGKSEKDISNISVSIQSNRIGNGTDDAAVGAASAKTKLLEINTSQSNVGTPSMLQKQQFISPKIQKPAMSSGMKLNQTSIISPQNSRIVGHSNINATSIDKKPRGTSNNKVSNFTKNPSTLNAAFSPDKRPNISRSQIQNNLFLKRGVKGQQANADKSQTRENNRMQHQRMFAGQNQVTQPSNNTPGTSVSPSTKTGPQSSGPSYMQSTFSRATKTNKNNVIGRTNVHNYQLNRVRPSNKGQSTNTTQENIPASVAMGTTDKNSNSQKDLVGQATIKVLDQQAAPIVLTQSQGPKIGAMSSSSAIQGRQQQSQVYSKPSIGGGQSASKKTKGNTQSYQWQGQNFYPGSKVQESSSSKQRTGVPTSTYQPQSSTNNNKQSRNQYRPASKRNSTNEVQKKQSQTIPSSITAKTPSNNLALVSKSITSSKAMVEQVSRRQSSLIINDQFVKAVIEQPMTKTQAPTAEQFQDNSATAKLQVYKTPLASHSEVYINKATPTDTNKKQNVTSGKQSLPKKSHSSMSDTSAVTSDAIAASYKQKQEQIIEMIQSNMKRSEDIQQSLSSGSKFFQSVTGPPPTNKDMAQSKAGGSSRKASLSTSNLKQLDDSNQKTTKNTGKITKKSPLKDIGLQLATFGADPEPQVPLLKAPSPSKASSQVKGSFVSSENQPDIPVFQGLMTNKESAINQRPSLLLSELGQEESLGEVEDVFNDAQLLQNRIAQKETTPQNDERISLLPQIQPAEQPEDGSSSENGCVEGDTSPIHIMASIAEKPQIVQQQPQSAFAKALANKKSNGENFQKAIVKESDEHPFNQAEEDKPITMEELEVVTEDATQEDRHSLASSATKSFIKSVGAPPNSALPMKREAFIALYMTVLTEQEKKELDVLDLTNGLVYYANDIPTRINASAAITNKDDEDGYYVLQAKDHLLYRFEVLKVLGKGSFAQVVSAIDHLNGKVVAVKVNRNTEIDHKFAKAEGKLLQFLMDEDPQDDNNIVRMSKHIHFREHQCFVFELLNTDLFEHLKENEFKGFPVEQIRSYAAQLLKALVFLEKRNVIHCDLKPENILCVDPARSQLKVVDFGSGCLTNEQVYTYVQSRYYRAPEVILRIPYSEKVDMWSLGCILAELFTGEPLFPGNNEQEQLEFIMELQGMFPETMIEKSRKKDHYFDTDFSPFLIEDPKYGILRIPENRRIEEAIPSQDSLFLDFVSQCLVLNPDTRPGAQAACTHPWIRSFFGGPAYEPEHVGQLEERDFDLPQTSESYQPLRQVKRENTLNALQGNMFGEDEDDIGQEEYFEGRISASERALTETGGFGSQQNDASDGEETVKFGQSIVSQSRQREEAGARASAAEISPDRPLGSFLSNEQRMTSFTQQQDGGGGFNIYPVVSSLQSSGQKPSPLKPSNESLLEHYKYEKQSKGQVNTTANFTDLYANSGAGSAKKSASKPKQQNSAAAANVEEPMIISMSTSSFGKQ